MKLQITNLQREAYLQTVLSIKIPNACFTEVMAVRDIFLDGADWTTLLEPHKVDIKAPAREFELTQAETKTIPLLFAMAAQGEIIGGPLILAFRDLAKTAEKALESPKPKKVKSPVGD